MEILGRRKQRNITLKTLVWIFNFKKLPKAERLRGRETW